MGESNSKPQVNSEFLRSYQADYRMICEQRDERLGNVKVSEGPGGALVAEKSITAGNKEDVEQFLNGNLRKALEIQNRYLMKLHAYKVFQEDSMCGSISSVSTYHEYHQNTVQDELIRRNQVSLFYMESELWAILYSIVSAASYLERSGNHPLTDIRPSTVYFTLNGEVKLLPFGIYLNDQSAYSKVFATGEPCLLSPEQLLKLKGNSSIQIKGHISDSFSIGMLLLIAATLQTSLDMYNFDEFSIKQDFVNELFAFSSRQFSRFFNNILRLMLTQKPEERPSPSEIFAILQPFEADILSLRQFNPDYNVISNAVKNNPRFSEKQTASLTQQDDLPVFETPYSQTVENKLHNQQLSNSAVVNLPYLCEDGSVYYKQTAPEPQFKYIISQQDGKPIQQLENHFFYNDYTPQQQAQQPLLQSQNVRTYQIDENQLLSADHSRIAASQTLQAGTYTPYSQAVSASPYTNQVVSHQPVYTTNGVLSSQNFQAQSRVIPSTQVVTEYGNQQPQHVQQLSQQQTGSFQTFNQVSVQSQVLQANPTPTPASAAATTSTAPGYGDHYAGTESEKVAKTMRQYQGEYTVPAQDLVQNQLPLISDAPYQPSQYYVSNTNSAYPQTNNLGGYALNPQSNSQQLPSSGLQQVTGATSYSFGNYLQTNVNYQDPVRRNGFETDLSLHGRTAIAEN